MALLIILIVATAVLVAWLLVQLARVGLADFRLPRLRESSLGGASPAGSPTPAVRGGATEHGGSEPETDHSRREIDRAGGQWPPRREEHGLDDEPDVERAVRDRLYGRHGRRD